jgi:hypothetical protein
MALGRTIGGPVGSVLGSYWGAVVTPVMANLAKRLLSPKELERMELVQKLGLKKFDENIRKGCKLRTDIQIKKFSELAEGILLTSRNAYEEKKIPLLVNLIANAPFTNTPLENMTQTLHEAERMSYRQLCLLAIIDKQEYGDIGLRSLPFGKEKAKHLNEFARGVYQDLNLMIVDGVIAMIISKEVGPVIASGVGTIVPSELVLLYPGDLLVNGLELAGIPESEKKPLIRILN